MELIKLSFVESDGLTDGIIRPYDMDRNGSAVELFSKATNKGFDLGAKRIASLAAPLLGPSSRRKIEAHIPNGWDAKRIMFAMVVSTAKHNNSREFSYIVGCTDEAKYTTRGTTVEFDPNMKLYLNNITRIHMTEASILERGGRGMSTAWQPRIVSHDQVLNRDAIRGFDHRSQRRNPKAQTLRPTDLFTRAGGESAFGSYLQNRETPVKNLCGAFSQQLRLSTRANNSSTMFTQRGLNAYVSAAANPGSAFIDDNNDHDTILSAIDSVIENNVEADPYIEEIRRDSNIIESGYITFGELMEMNPDFDEDRQLPFIPLGKKRRSENVVGFKSDENESIAAAMIAHALPGILINSMYSSVDGLVINSRARMGESKLVTAFPQPFVQGMSVRASWPYFEDMITDVMLHEVTKGGMFDIEAKIDANIDQMINIWIKVDGGEEAYFEFPAFCDSFLAPTLDNDELAFDALSKGIVDLSSALSRDRLRSTPSHVAEPVILTGTDAAGSRFSNPQDSVRDARAGSSRQSSTRSNRDW